MAQPVREKKYDMIEADFIGTAMAHIMVTRRQIGLDEEEIANSGIGFVEAYKPEPGKRKVCRNAATPEHVLPYYHIECFRQLNNVDLKRYGAHAVSGWVFMRYGSNPLRKMKIKVTYHTDDSGRIGVVNHDVIDDSIRPGFREIDYPELAEDQE